MSITEWRDQGVLPEALNNFVALLGWSHGLGGDLLNMNNLINHVFLPALNTMTNTDTQAGQS